MADTLVKKACIIDDDKLYVSLIRMLVRKNKLDVELLVFENGKLAFNYFKEELTKETPRLPEVILLDLNMPIMDGWEFLEAVEPFADMLNARLFVVSSTINPVEVRKVNKHKFVTAFMTKPINKDAMVKFFTK
jgi:response regulator RpfG family c-di-GMP phosphodiesterase